MHCPNCRQKTLEEFKIGNIKTVVERCQVCGGIWFDRMELESIMELAVAELIIPPGAEETERCCPRDGEIMFAFKYPQTDVTVDMCKKCDGLWLDGGELTEIKKTRVALAGSGKLDKRSSTTTLGRLVDWVVDEINDLGLDLD